MHTWNVHRTNILGFRHEKSSGLRVTPIAANSMTPFCKFLEVNTCISLTGKFLKNEGNVIVWCRRSKLKPDIRRRISPRLSSTDSENGEWMQWNGLAARIGFPPYQSAFPSDSLSTRMTQYSVFPLTITSGSRCTAQPSWRHENAMVIGLVWSV